MRRLSLFPFLLAATYVSCRSPVLVFDSVSCTSDTTAFLTHEFSLAMSKVHLLVTALQNPSADTVQDVRDVFGDVRNQDPYGNEVQFDPIAFPRWVFAGGMPGNPEGQGLRNLQLPPPGQQPQTLGVLDVVN